VETISKKMPNTAFQTTLSEIAGIFRRSPEWILIILAWCVAAFLPYVWFMGEDHSWIDPTSFFFFEPFIPLAFAALCWQDRELLLSAYQKTYRTKRRGTPYLLWFGCCALLLSHLVHVMTFAVLSLLIIAAGVIYLSYGMAVLIQSARMLLFSLLMIPPPETAVTVIYSLVGKNISKLVTILAQHTGRHVSVMIGIPSSLFDLQGNTVEVPHRQASAIIFAIVLTIFWALWRRIRFATAFVAIGGAAFLSLIFSTLALFAAVMLPVSAITDPLALAHPLLIAAISVGVTILLEARLGGWWAALARRSRVVSQISERTQKMTDRVTGSLVAGVSGRVGRTGRGMTKGTETIIDGFFRFIARPFKRKRRDW